MKEVILECGHSMTEAPLPIPPNPALRCHALLPCAGSGSRAGTAAPKQYQPVAGLPMVLHTLAAFQAVDRIERCLVVVSPGDRFLSVDDPHIQLARVGGSTRAASVFNGLQALLDSGADDSDWVLVHDAARPCLAPWHIDRLVRELAHDEAGGLLAVPVADTLKRADTQRRVLQTVPRDSLWQAQTPQMFRYVMLRRALEGARDVTDEASAIEAAGLHPKLVQGDATNLKVTYPLDLHLAEWILKNREGRA